MRPWEYVLENFRRNGAIKPYARAVERVFNQSTSVAPTMAVMLRSHFQQNEFRVTEPAGESGTGSDEAIPTGGTVMADSGPTEEQRMERAVFLKLELGDGAGDVVDQIELLFEGVRRTFATGNVRLCWEGTPLDEGVNLRSLGERERRYFWQETDRFGLGEARVVGVSWT